MIDVLSCPYCGDESFHNQIPGRDWFECDCGMIYKAYRKTEEELAEFYRTSQYHDSRGISSIKQDALERNRAKRIVKHLPIGGERMLDIGCARGYLLQFARNRGYRVLGVEPSEGHSFEEIPVVHDLDNVRGKFDVIACIHTLEHVIDFKHVIERIKELLTDKGLVLIEVPSLNSSGVYVDAHLYIFKPTILQKLFEPLRNDLLKFTPHTFMTFRRDK